MNPTMTEHRLDWEDKSMGERHYGDITNVRADEDGNYSKATYDSKINLFGRWSIFGRMCDLHMPKGTLYKHRNRDNDAAPMRAVSFGVMGRTKWDDEVPQWDLGPHVCFGADSSPIHGGYDPVKCETWKALNKDWPQIIEDMDEMTEEHFPSIYEITD